MSAPGPLSGRVGIVTGAGKGLGRAFALNLAAAGAAVVVNNRNRQVDEHGDGPADHVVREIRAAGGQAVADHSDVADPGAPAAMLERALSTWGRLDFLVANAAISGPAMFHKLTDAQFDAVTAINLGGTAHLARCCSVHLRAAGFGRIVLIGSTAGLHGEPTASAYTASKGAVIALGRAIAVEGARRNVLTNVVLPYATTQMTDSGMAQAYRQMMTPEAVAPVVTALVDPDCSLNGQVMVSAAGALRAAAAVEYGTVPLPSGGLSPDELAALLERSRQHPPREYEQAVAGFLDFAAEISHD